MRRRHNFLIGFFVCLAVILLSGGSVYAAQETSKVLKVAYYPLAGFFDYDEQGKESGYGVEVLDKISQYTGIQFEYVKVDSWEDTKQMLLDGTADIRMPGTMPATPSTTLTYSNTSILDTYEVMLTLKSRDDLYYQDYDTIHTLKIAIVDSFYSAEEVEKYLSDIGVKEEQLVFCTEYNECYDKLKAGEVDALITNIMDMTDDLKMLERFNSVSNYITMVLGNSDMNAINEAITDIKLEEPMFFANLYEKWFPEQVTIPLTFEENEYLADIDTLTFAFRKDEGYLSHYSNGEYYGIYVDQAKRICEKLGKKFRAVSTEECLEGKETTDVYTGFFYDQNYAKEWGFEISAPISDINYYIVQKREKNFDPSLCKIAAIKKFKYTSDYLETMYKNAEFQYYDSYEECLQAVERGKADMTIINNYIAEYYLGMYQYNDLSVQLSNDYSHMFCFATDQSKGTLASILTKALSMISDKEMTNTYITGQENKPQTRFIQGILYKNPILVVAGAAALAAIVIVMIMLVLFSKKQKKQNLVLEDALSVKSSFMASMSHDMRTPMNGILGMIRLSKDSSNIKEIHQNMDKAESAGEYMLSLINDTLDLQRLESKKMELNYEVVPVSEYYDKIFSILKISAEEKNIDFQVHYIKIDLTNYIKLDPVRVKQILSNLISNAVKFTPEGGAVVVTVENLGEEQGMLHRKYQVKDTGVGMSEEFIRDRLFKAYSQEANQMSSQLTGSGLGMAITKNLVEAMGGRIEVESTLGEGSTFTVYLDLQKATEDMICKAELQRKEEEENMRTDISGRRILLCEDQPLNAEIAGKLLEKAGCEIVWEQDGKAGLERFRKEKENFFDLILMDIRMPNMDGLQATRAIRGLDRADAKSVPIVAMTANAYASDIRNCLDAGMNAHLAKPVNPQMMYKVIQKNLNKKSE